VSGGQIFSYKTNNLNGNITSEGAPATSRAGIDRGMDRLVSMEGYGRILSAIAAVMTEQRFRQGVRPFKLHP
jgi:hypothetical protein